METASAEVLPFETQAETKAHEFATEAQGLLSVAEAYEIDSHQMYGLAATELSKIKARYNAINEARMTITRPMDEAKKRVMAFFDQPLIPLKAAEKLLKDRMSAWDTEQERIRQEREAKARRAREEEQRKADAVAAEAKKKADDARKAAQAIQDKEARRKAEEEAAKATEEAEVAADEAEILEHAPTPIVVAETPHVSTVVRRKTYSAEVTDLMKLVKAIANDNAPISLIKADNVALNGLARSLKEAMDVPGVRVVVQRGIASK